MNITPDNKIVFMEWTADSRYFEKKPSSYFRAILVLSILMSVLLYFIHEYLLVFLVWVIYFVTYVRAVVPPPSVKYTLGKFGLGFFSSYLNYNNMSFFGVLKKNEGLILRIFSKPETYEYNVVLPKNQEEAGAIIDHLKERVPYLEQIPQSNIEKLAAFLHKLTGLG